MSSKKSSRRASRQSHRSTLSLQRTEIIINVYDLLPPGRLSNMLWTFGTSLLHTGVVINSREYAYGGHDQPGKTGVYWTSPRSPPPGGSFRTEILHGFTFATRAEVDAIIRHTSESFLGPAYNLLTRNCNHFTQTLCEQLTGRRGPGWLNRAAQVGVALPCIVPRDWMEPPDWRSAEGALMEGEEEDAEGFGAHEGMGLIEERRERYVDSEDEEEGMAGSAAAAPPVPATKGKAKRSRKSRDSGGRPLPPAERAPVPVGIAGG